MSKPVAAIVLAAGLSSRLAPANKLLVTMSDGHALVAHTVRHALASNAAPVIVVTGFQAKLIEAALAGLPVRFVYAENYAEGLAASLHAGIAALPPEIQAVLVVLGDMPLVRSQLLDALIAAYDPQSGRDIVVPVWQSRRGNPRLWGHRFFDEFLSLSGDAGANRLLDAYPDRIVEIDACDDAVLRDFDTKEAIDRLPLD